MRALPVLILALSALTTAFGPPPATPLPPADPEPPTRDLSASEPLMEPAKLIAPEPKPLSPVLVMGIVMRNRVLDAWELTQSRVPEEEVPSSRTSVVPASTEPQTEPTESLNRGQNDDSGQIDADSDSRAAPGQTQDDSDMNVSERTVWDRLADCESGNWIDGGASFEQGSARWAWGGADPIPPWGTSVHHGGLQFHPVTWTWLKDEHHPAHAYDATREQQIAVAERVLAEQGWKAWPVCSQKLGLR